MVIEAVGLPEVWQLAIKLLRRGGVVNFFGGCPSGTEVGVDTDLLHYSELTLKASFHHTPALVRKALETVSRGYVSAQGPRESRGAARQSAGSDAAPDEPQRPPEDRDHPLESDAVFLAPTAFLASPEQLERAWPLDEVARLHALAGHPSLRKFPRRQLPAAQAPAPGFLQRLFLLPLGRRSGRRDRRPAGKPAAARLVARELQAMYAGDALASGVCRAQGHRRRGIHFPCSLFDDLIKAFEQDQTVTRYREFRGAVRVLPLFRESGGPAGAGLVRLSRRGAAGAFRCHLHGACSSPISGRM